MNFTKLEYFNILRTVSSSTFAKICNTLSYDNELFYTNKRSDINYIIFPEEVYIKRFCQYQNLSCIPRKTKLVCLEFMKQFKYNNEYELKDIEYYVLKKCIKRYPYNIKMIQKQTDNLCKIALKKDISLINYMNQNDNLCKYAININNIKHSDNLLCNIKNKSIEICQYAVNKNIHSFKYTKGFQTPEMCNFIIKQCPSMIEFADYQTEENCWIAIKYNPALIEFIKNQTIDMCYYCVKNSPKTIALLNDKNIFNNDIDFILKNPIILKYMDKQTDEFYYKIIHADNNMVKYISNLSQNLISLLESHLDIVFPETKNEKEEKRKYKRNCKIKCKQKIVPHNHYNPCMMQTVRAGSHGSLNYMPDVNRFMTLEEPKPLKKPLFDLKFNTDFKPLN